MKLLIITQSVDMNDPVLGFFHNWLKKFSAKFDHITVVCLFTGEHNLPSNIKVLSLGKEDGSSKIKYTLRLFKYIWNERANYEKVFVHMNQEYVLLGKPLWYLLGKEIFFWRNHRQGNWLTRLAVYFSTKVFCTSPDSYTARFKKAILMPVGVDTDFFHPPHNNKREGGSVFMLGRISPVKRVDLFIEALIRLKNLGLDFKAYIIGSPDNEKDQVYAQKLHQMAIPILNSGHLIFLPAVNQEEARDFFQSKDVYVNLTPAGSMDKTIFEAMACEAVTVVDNSDNICRFENKLEQALNTVEETKANLRKSNREKVVAEHSLKLLVDKLFNTMTN